ncbi:MAG: DUF4189 domain-containing protein [Stenotrophomonas sp.]
MLLVAALGAWAGEVKAWQSCQDVVVGTKGNQPIFQQQCAWLAGAVALNPQTRAMGAVWNYPDADQAKAAALRDCGPACLVVSFYDDHFYLAASEQDDIGYAASADRALLQCLQSSRDTPCDVIVSAGSAGPPLYWHFNALAYNSSQKAAYGWTGAVRRGEAKAGVLKACGGEPECFAYVHQLEHAAMAEGENGKLYAADGNTAGKARRAAIKYCSSEQGKKAKCGIVAETSALNR